RVRSVVLDMADSGGGEDAEVARLLGFAQLLLSSTLHAHSLPSPTGVTKPEGAAVAATSQSDLQPSQQHLTGPTGRSDPWVTPTQAWEALTKAVATAVRPVLGEGIGSGGGRASGGSGGATVAAAAHRAAGAYSGGQGGALHVSLTSLLNGMKELVARQNFNGTSTAATVATSSQQPSQPSSQSSQPQMPSASLAAVAAIEAALRRQVSALRRVVDPIVATVAAAGPSAGNAGGGWQAGSGQGGPEEEDDDFGGVTRRPVLRSRLAVGGGAGPAGGSAGGATGGGGGGGSTTQLVGTAAGTQLLTGPGTAAAVLTNGSASTSQYEQALAAALGTVELLEAFAPVYGIGVSQIVDRTFSTLMERRQQQQTSAFPQDQRLQKTACSGAGGNDDDYMDIDVEDEIEEPDGGSDGSDGGGGGGVYGSRGSVRNSCRGASAQSPPPPEELVAALARVAVTSAVAVGADISFSAAARVALNVAETALGAERGLLSLRFVRYDEPRSTSTGIPTYKVVGRQVSEYQMVVAAVQLRRLARHLGTSGAAAFKADGGDGDGDGGGSAANAPGLDQLLAAGGVHVLRDAVRAMDEAFNTNDFVPYSWQLRAAVAALTVELLPLNMPRFSPGMPEYDMSDLVGSLRLLPCWQEPSYRARRTGATLTRILFRRFTAHKQLLVELDLPQLAGDMAERTADRTVAVKAPQPRSLTETAILTYAEILQLSSKLEVVVARRLLAHAALCRRDEALVASCLRLGAARLGYGTTADYLAAIMRPLAWSWFTVYDISTLMAVAPILTDGTAALDPWVGGGSATDPRVVFLRRNQGSVLLPLVIGDLQPPAEMVATLLGVQLNALLSEHVPYIFGTLLLLKAAGEGRWLDEVARNQLVSGSMDVEGDVDRQLSNRTYLFLANMLLDVVPEGEASARLEEVTRGSGPAEAAVGLPTVPTFSAETCCRAVLDIPGLPTPEENEAFLWTSLLPPHSVAWAAAALHEALAGGSSGAEVACAAAAAAAAGSVAA
ncbi:hypothetical protein Vafri_16893, partial [Volvox africanus]